MRDPSGEKCGKTSCPTGEESFIAVPPCLGTTHKSPAYENTMCVCDTSGYWSMRAYTGAAAGGAITASKMAVTRSRKRVMMKNLRGNKSKKLRDMGDAAL